ncbi:ABC transporter substrate-binding protein [Methanosphaera sp.]|uniref:ABC transporter substrate-binding protein n=1 Tax=Methanosphaera sp. TaxID=2666342 RepID=UPI002E78A513|nr:ABC transporter substrate-binding protein [Methanosphaera sp.]MEE1116942.1 ABC transporter substrate-binding protein [Methanosphaera sp.]
MDNKYIIGGVVALIAIIAIAAFAMGGTSTQRAPDELAMAVSNHGGEPEAGFDPLTGWATGTEPLIQSTIFKHDGNGKLVNDLATGYTVSGDGKTIDVELRDGVKFTDDTPLTAEDVAFTYNTAKETGVTNLDALDKAEAVDDTHVKFTLSDVDSSFVHRLASVGIVPSDSYNNETYGEHPVGSGPYKLSQWDKGQQAIFEVNENYYGKKPFYKKITNLFMEPDAAFAAAQKGDVDIVEVPLSYANETIEGMHQVIYPSLDIRYIGLPVNNETTNEDGVIVGNNITADPAIRQAINVGIDRQAMVEGAYNGLGNVSYIGTSNLLPWASDYKIEDGKVDEAKQILAAAGWTDTNGDGIVEKDGKTASFDIDYSSSDSTRQAVALQFSEQVKQFGIEAKPNGKTWDEMDTTKFNQPIVWGGGSADPHQLYNFYDSEVAANEYSNPAAYNNSAVDALIGSAMANPNLESSYSTWSQVEPTAAQDVPYVWIGTLDYLMFVSDSVDLSDDTHTIYPHGGDIWGNVYDWTSTNATANATS